MNKNFGITVQAILDANAGQQLQASLNKLSNLKINVDVSNNGIQNANKNIDSFTQSTNIAKQSTTGLTGAVDGLVENVGKVAAWSLATSAIYSTKQALDELYTNMIEIEGRMIELERVTSGIDLQTVFDGAYESSQRFGASLYDTLDAVTEIARSYGDLNEEQIVATASAATLATTISDLDGENAVKTIIAISNAYGLLIEDSELLIDMINEVDNNYAISSQVLADGLRKSSATAKTFGTDLEELTGYITAISATTQESGNIIGNSLKTILSRLTTIGGAETELANVGIAIRDSSGAMKGSSDILDELSLKWETLTEEQKQNIGLQVAGTNQLSRFLALMDNYDIALNATTTALNSQGSAARENIIYINSYEAKLNKLENAQLALAQTVSSSSLTNLSKTFIDAQIAITELTTSILKFSDATTIAIVGLVGLVSALSKTANGKKILSQITGLLLTQEQQEANLALKNAQAQSGYQSILSKVTTTIGLKQVSINKAKASTEQYTIATMKNKEAQDLIQKANIAQSKGNSDLAVSLRKQSEAAQVSANSATKLANSYKAAGIAAQVAGTLMQAAFTLGIGIVIGAIVNWVTQLANATSEATDAAIESADELNQWNSELETSVSNVKKYREELLASNITTEDAAMYKQNLIDIEDTLIERYGEEAKNIDLVNGSLKEQVALINELQQKESQDWLNTNQKAIDNAREDTTKVSDNVSETMWGFGSYGQVDYMTEVANQGGFDTLAPAKDVGKATFFLDDVTVAEQMEYWRQLSENTQKNQEQIKETYGLNDEQIQEILNDASTNLNNLEKKYGESFIVMEEAAAKSLTARDDYYLFLDALEQGTADGELNREEIASLLGEYEGLEEAFGEAGITLDDLVRDFEVVSSVIQDAEDATLKYYGTQEALNDAIEKNNNSLDSIQSAYNSISNAMNEYNSSGGLSIDTMQELLALDDRYLMTLLDKNGALQLNENSFRTLVDAELDNAEALALNQALTDLNTIANNNDAVAIENLRIKYANLRPELDNVAIGYNNITVAAAKARTAEGVEGVDDLVNSIESSLSSKLAVINATRSSINSSIAQGIGGGTSSSSSGSQKTYFDYVEERLDKYTNTLEALDLELSIVQERFKNLEEGSSDWFANLDQQEAIIRRTQQATLDYANAIRQELNSSRLSSEERIELNNLLQEQTLEYEKQNTALNELIETEKDYYRSEIEDKVDVLKDLEDERHEKAIENIEKEREAFEKAIDNQISLIQKAEDARQFDKEIDELEEEKQAIQNQINRLEGDDSRLANSKRLELEEELADLNDEISESQIDRENELREESLNDLAEQKDAEYDILEEAENKKNELILSNLEERTEGLDEFNLSVEELNSQMSELERILNQFPDWATTFNSLSGIQSLSNIAGVVTGTNSQNNNSSQQSFIINVTANSQAEGQKAGQAIVDELIKNGIITSGNTF